MPESISPATILVNSWAICIFISRANSIAAMKRPLTESELKECAALKAIFLRVKSETKLTQESAANALGLGTQGAVSQYLNGKIALNLSIAIGFANLLGCMISDFSPRLAGTLADHGAISNNNTEAANGPHRSFLYPEISEVAAGSAMEAIDLLQPGEGERHQSDAWAGKHGFWLRVKGDSMTTGAGVSFPQGMLVLVSPEDMPVSGQFIVAKIGNDVTFKQYVIDAGVRYLKPLNAAYQQQVMDDRWTVVGTVIDAKWPKSIF